MKKIILKSSLSEDEALKKLKVITDGLVSQNLIAKGDELVAEVDEDGSDLLITINGDLMSNDNYSKIKSELLKIGKVTSNDLKNFDEEPDPEPEKKSEVAEGQEKEDKKDAVTENSLKPAIESLHDSSELIININKNVSTMGSLKELLFSDEEIGKAPKSPEEVAAEKEAAEKKPEAKEHDDEPKGEKKDEPAKPEEKKDPEEPKKPEDPKPEEKKEDPSKPEEKKEVTFDDLLFSEEELKEPKKDEPAKPEDKKDDPEPKKEDPKDNGKDGLVEMLKDVKEKVTKIFDQMPPRTPEEKNDLNKECPIAKEEALKALKEYRRKAADGKSLSVAEKYFCDSMTKFFTEEELKDEEKPAEPKKEDPKPEEPKKPEEPAKVETKDELIRRLNNERMENTLRGKAKENINKIK